jgi:hypothetical protein
VAAAVLVMTIGACSSRSERVVAGGDALTTTETTATTTPVTAPAATGLVTTTTLPSLAGGRLAVEGELVRGAPATAVASGFPAGLELDLVVSDAGQHIPVADVTTGVDGTARVGFVVPTSGMHEGICTDGGPCEYRSVGLGPHQLSLSWSAYDLTGAAAVAIDLVPARPHVAYPTHLFGECGPIRTELDGRTWIADTPSSFDDPAPPDLVSLAGTLTLTSATHATFRAEDGRTGRLTATVERFFC